MFVRKQQVYKFNKRTGEVEKQWRHGEPKVYTVKDTTDYTVVLYNNPDVVISQNGEVLGAPTLLKSNWSDCKIMEIPQ